MHLHAYTRTNFLAIFVAFLLARDSAALGSASSTMTDKGIKKGYRVCTASPCSPNGSELLYDALQTLSTKETTIKKDYCLGGCCSGTVIKPYGITNARRRTLPIIGDEQKALETAGELLREVGGLDQLKWDEILAKVETGERAFENSNEPDICSNCGVGLQLYRGNCAKCGKYPY